MYLIIINLFIYLMFFLAWAKFLSREHKGNKYSLAENTVGKMHSCWISLFVRSYPTPLLYKYYLQFFRQLTLAKICSWKQNMSLIRKLMRWNDTITCFFVKNCIFYLITFYIKNISLALNKWEHMTFPSRIMRNANYYHSILLNILVFSKYNMYICKNYLHVQIRGLFHDCKHNFKL